MSAAKKIADGYDMMELPLSNQTYQFFADKMYDIAGVHLPVSDKNLSLVKNRLTKILRKYELGSFEELAQRMRNPDTALLEMFISSLTTNKTHFFREDAHFKFLKQQLSTHFQTENELRIWCAAASTGQEPYTLATVVSESVPTNKLSQCKILATDIDLDVLKKAVNGVYTETEMDGLPRELRTKYFENRKDGTYRAKDELASLLHFARFNLVQDAYQFKKPFHYIFCRNVLIYFDPPTTKRVIASLASCLGKDWFLILGHSESGTVNDPQIKALSQATYRRI